MNSRSIRRPLLVAGAIVVLLAVLGLMTKPGTPADVNSVFKLQAPPFVGIARAETGSLPGIIEDEAGISAWFQASFSINLNSVRGVYRTIEAETADYIIGSVPVPNYPETEDVHVYVHKDGWILAYYLAGDPVGKIFDWRMYHDTGRTNITTKLENAITVVASAGGVPFSGATYYDFQYPNATHLMLIVEWVYNGTDSFQVKLPGTFVYYERSWSLGTGDEGWYKLDGLTIRSHPCCQGWIIWHGTLTATQLLPDQYHWIEVNGHEYGGGEPAYSYGGLALVYRVP